MTVIADALLLLAAISATFYCRILAVRLRNLSKMDVGLGGAISAMSAQVDDLKAALTAVSAQADLRSCEISRLTSRADSAARRLELLLASLHEKDDGEMANASDLAPLKLAQRDRIPAKKPEPALRGETPPIHGQRKDQTIPDFVR